MPDNPLTQETIEALAEKFNLCYQIPQAAICQKEVGFAGKQVLEIGGSLPPEFVFDHLNVSQWTAVETPDYNTSLLSIGGINHTGTMLFNSRIISRTFKDPAPLERYTFYHDDIINLPKSLENRFDLVFSLAAFEHIHRFPQAIERMYAALKPGGKLFSYFSPVWSSFHGHHLPDIQDASGNAYNFMSSPIPPWGHLLFSAPEMLNLLESRTDKATAETMVYYIYNAPSINRFFLEDYLAFIQQTPFVIEDFTGILPASPYPQEVRSDLEKRYPGRTFFNLDGLQIILVKR